MYRVCGDSQIGKSHESKGTICQDAHFCLEKEGVVFAAVADGLGSSKHSDIASKMASREAVEYCAKSIYKGMADNQILATIKAAFDAANFSIKQRAGDNLDDYDTTLTLAVLIGDELYYGHAGDSGIIALRSDGIFEEVTTPQQGSGQGKDRPVFPLASVGHWVFCKYKYRVKALFLMTDGVLNKAIPPLLEEQSYRLDNKYLYFLFDNLQKNNDLNTWVSGELAQTSPQEVNYDDKTLVGVINIAAKVNLQDKKYYDYPTDELWTRLTSEHERKLYPYRESNESPPPGTSSKSPEMSAKKSVTQKNNSMHKYITPLVILCVGMLLGVSGTLIITSLFGGTNENDNTQTVYSSNGSVTDVVQPPNLTGGNNASIVPPSIYKPPSAGSMQHQAPYNVWIDFINEQLIGFFPGAEYMISGIPLSTTKESRNICIIYIVESIVDGHYMWVNGDLELRIIRVASEEDGREDSYPFDLPVPSRPPAPCYEDIESVNDWFFEIEGNFEIDEMEFRDFGDYDNEFERFCEECLLVTRLVEGHYEIRFRATQYAFASLTASITISDDGVMPLRNPSD